MSSRWASITEDDIEEYLARARVARRSKPQKVTGGYSNATFRAAGFLVKVDIRGRNLLSTDVWARRKLIAHGIPTPSPIKLDRSRKLLPWDCLILRWTPGTSLKDAWPELGASSQERVSHQAASLLHRIHRLTGGRSRRRTFVAAYAAHLARASRLGILSARSCAHLLHHARSLPAIPRPALVHGDFHASNLISGRAGLLSVTDLELAFCGDPAMDFANRLKLDLETPGFSERLRSAYGRICGHAPAVDPLAIHHRIWFALGALDVARRFDLDTAARRDSAPRRDLESLVGLLSAHRSPAKTSRRIARGAGERRGVRRAR
jgi:aminoglycoside phosphotransferase (APT) family kinase protein